MPFLIWAAFWGGVYLFVNLGRLDRGQEPTRLWLMTWTGGLPFGGMSLAFFNFWTQDGDFFNFSMGVLWGCAFAIAFILGFFKEWPKSSAELAAEKAFAEQLQREEKLASEIPSHPCWNQLTDDDTLIARFHESERLRRARLQRPIL